MDEAACVNDLLEDDHVPPSLLLLSTEQYIQNSVRTRAILITDF